MYIDVLPMFIKCMMVSHVQGKDNQNPEVPHLIEAHPKLNQSPHVPTTSHNIPQP